MGSEAASRLDFGVLGPLTIRAGQQDVAVEGAVRKAVLMRLLLSRNQVVVTDQLLEDVWDGRPPPGALSSLRAQVSRLRSALGSDRLVHRGEGYLLTVADSELDVDRFEQLARLGGRALGAGDSTNAARLLGEALDCWRGPALADVRDAPWAQGEARRLEEGRAAALEAWLEARLHVGEHGEVASLAEKAIIDHPYRERLWAHLMEALYRSGRQAEAVAAYQRLRRQLGDELGLTPSKELADLELAILNHDAALEPPGRPEGGDAAPGEWTTDPEPAGMVVKTLLFTDVVDSVSLWDRDAAAAEAAIRAHQRIIAAAVARHQGRVVTRMGDGAFVAFDRAEDAVAAAVEVQREMQTREWPGVGRLAVRMGLHTGECRVVDNDPFGHAVNIAARLESVAAGGQIVISDATAASSAGKLPADVATSALGDHRLRGVDNPIALHMVLADGLPAEFPPLRTAIRGLEELPAETTSLIGREALLGEIAEAIGRERLTTLWGPGGSGKTRLAVRVARQARRPFLDGIQFVDLAGIASSDVVASALITLLRAQPLGDEAPLETIVRVLRPLRLLLVLDNAEHVRDGVRQLVAAVRESCHSVHTLVTSREALDLEGEQLVHVPPLGVPVGDRSDPDYILQFDSVRLFLDRGRHVDSGFRIHEDNAAAVARLCRALDGMPLSLELAAARLAVEAVDELLADERGIVAQLERSQSDTRTSNLARSIEWSLEKLDGADLALFELLAMFAAPFTRDQMLGIADDPASAQQSLDRLVRRAVVVRDPDSARYRLLATSKEYVERHGEDAERIERRDRHARLMLRRATDVSPVFRTSRQQYACEILRTEFPDYRQAMHCFVAGGSVDEAAELLIELFQFGFNNTIAEVSDWAVQLATVIPDAHPRATEVCGAAAMAWWARGETDQAIAAGERAVRCAEITPGAPTIWARTALLNALSYAGRLHEAGPNYTAFVDDLRRSPEAYWQVLGLGYEGISFMMFGRTDRARDRIDRALALARRSGNPECLHWALYCLGRLLEPADPEAASAAFEEAMDAARSVESRLYLGFDLLEWIGVRRRLGDAPSSVVGVLELMDILHSSGTTAQLSQMYCEAAQVLADAGDVSAAATVFLARSGLPHMPKGMHLAEPETALQDRLRDLAGDQWRVFEVRAAAMTDEALMTYARARLERLLTNSAVA